MKKNHISIEFIKFLFAGGLNTFLSYFLFLLFYSFGFHYGVALIMVSGITIPHAYLWQRYWIFKSKNKIHKEFIKFTLVYIGIFFVNLGVLSFLVEWIGMDPRFAEIIAIGIAVIVTFTTQKYWSFSHRKL